MTSLSFTALLVALSSSTVARANASPLNDRLLDDLCAINAPINVMSCQVNDQDKSATQKAPVEPFRHSALNEFKGTYKGQSGGLYGDGKNEPPPSFYAAAQAAAAQIQPLNAGGQPEAGGKVGFISIGMSNTTQEFGTFVRLANSDLDMEDSIVLVDGAQGARDSKMWLFTGEEDDRGQASPWTVLHQRLHDAGLSPAQVQVLWLKQACADPALLGEFPAHARRLEKNLQSIVLHAKKCFPNLRIAFLSSRTYAGYANTGLNPEPFAFESAFSVRWLIERQINGDTELEYDSKKGVAKAPLLLWGPYLWTNGTEGRSSDALKWMPEDLVDDGTHPSHAGQRKIAHCLLHFFKTEPVAKSWFLKKSGKH